MAPWLHRSHESEQFDDSVLRPKAEVSAVWDLLLFTFFGQISDNTQNYYSTLKFTIEQSG